VLDELGSVMDGIAKPTVTRTTCCYRCYAFCIAPRFTFVRSISAGKPACAKNP